MLLIQHTRPQRLKTTLALFIVLSGLCCALFSNTVVATPTVLDRVVAVVDDDMILESELNERIRYISADFSKRGAALPPQSILQQQVLERLIQENIQLQLAKRGGLNVDDASLNQTLERIAEQNRMTLMQFQQNIVASGDSYPFIREQVRRELLISQVRQQIVGRRIKISEQDVKNFLASEEGKSAVGEEYQLSHILLAVPQHASKEELSKVENEARDWVLKLRNGANFSDVAARISQGENALEGGDIGWRKPTQLPTIFAERVVKMKKGDVADPIRSSSGFHIIKLSDVRGSDVLMVQQTQVRHILLKPNEIRSEADARNQINSLRQQILSGEKTFADVARTYSDDPSSANNGGELNWTDPGVFVPEFEKTMNSTDVGKISQPFLTQYGWHILEVLGRRNENQGPAFRENQARLALQKRRYDEELERWLREIRQEAYVDIKLD